MTFHVSSIDIRDFATSTSGTYPVISTPMKKQFLCAIALASLFTACEKTTVVPGSDSGKDTTVVVPGAPAEKKTENNTTIVNPPSQSKSESTSTTVNAPGASTETKTETKTNP